MKLSPTPTPPLSPSTSGRRSRHRRTPDGGGCAISAIQKSGSSDPARKLRSSVKLEFKSAIDGIRSAPDNAYKIASKFVYTFRRYIEPRRLSALLVKAMNNALQNAATDKRFTERIRSLLAFSDVWLRTRIDTECIERHDGFLSIIRKLNWATDEGVREWASRVMCSLLWALSGRRCGYVDEEFYSELAPDGSSGRLWSHKVSSLAEILSSIEWGKFVSIPFADFNNKAWSNAAEYPSRALLLRAFIDRSNRMSDWVLSSVLAQRTLPARAKAFEAFVLLAQECLQEGNYNSASAILGGLQVSEIDRVKSRLPVAKKYIFLFNMIVEQTSPVQNYAKYRRALAERMEARKRFIPITAVLLKDLTFIEDGNPDTRNEGTSINAEKMTLLQSTYEIMEVPLAGPTAVAEQFATALTAVTGLDTIDDHTISTYGFNKKWQMFGTPDGRRSYGLTEDMGILNASVVTRCGADYCGVNGRKLKVWTNSKATRLDWDLSGPIPRCIGFSFVRNGMPYVFRARKAVSLNAGLYSMRLLQVSGVGDASILAPVGIQVVADVPNVGKRGSNHVAYGYTLSSPSGARATDPTNGNFTCTMGGFLPNPLDTSDTRRGIQYIIQDGNSAANTPVTTTKAITVFNLHPSSRGYQHPLSPSIDGPWNVYYGYFDNTTDIDVLVAFHNQTILPLKAYMDAHQDVWAGWSWTNPSPSVMADLTQMRAFIIANARHAHHGCEYTLMAPCDQGGVVDPNTGAVCGVAGLFHVDTSVIPQPDGNNEHYVLAYSSIFSKLAVDNDWNFW